MASQAELKARENLMEIRRKRQQEEAASYGNKYDYSEDDDPEQVAIRNINRIRGRKQEDSNVNRLEELRKSAEERKLRQQAVNYYKNSNTKRTERKNAAEEIDRIMANDLTNNKARSNRMKRSIAMHQMDLEEAKKIYRNIITEKSDMSDSDRKKAIEELKKKIAMEEITGDSKTLEDLSRDFSKATGRTVSAKDAYQMMENASGEIDRKEFESEREKKKTELEQIQKADDFKRKAMEGSELAQRKNVYNEDLLAGYQNEDKQYPDIFSSTVEYKQYQDMTEGEKDIFNYYLATEGAQKAKEYLNTIKRDINKRQTEEQTEEMKKYAKEHPVLSSVSSVAAGFATGLGALETVRQNAENVITGENAPVDVNSVAFRPLNAQNTIRNTVQENFEGSEDIKALKRFLYQTGMSMADFTTQAAVGGMAGGFAGEAALTAGASAERAAQITASIAKNASLPIMGSGAMAQTVKEVIDNGGSTNQATQLGIIAGAAEVITERLGIDNLAELAKQGKNSVYRAVRKIVAEGAIPEGLEEVVSDIVNNMANDAIMQENSDFNRTKEQYMNMGMKEEEAKEKANAERVKNTVLSFLGGALSGGLMGAGAYAGGYIEGGNLGRELKSYEGFSDSQLINDAKSMKGTNAAELAQYYEGKGKLTDRKRAELFNQILTDSNGGYSRAEKSNIGEQKTEENKPVELTAEDFKVEGETQKRPETGYIDRMQENVPVENKMPVIETKRSYWDNKRVSYKGLNGNIEGIDRVENGKIYARVNTGEATIVQPVNNISFYDANTQKLYETAEGYKNAGARNFIIEYNGEDIEQYKKGYNAYYDAATVGIPMNKVNSVYGNMLSDRQKIAAYQAGEADLNFDERYEKLKTAREEKGISGYVVENEAFKGLDKNSQGILRSYAKMSGANIVIDEKISAGNGKYANGYYDNNGTIHIAADSDSPMTVVANHELTHYLQQYSPIYEEYRSKVIEYIMEKDGDTLDRLIEKHMSSYENTGRSISREEAMDEIAANASELFLTDEYAVRKLVEENRSIGEKILDFFKEFISKVKEMLKGYDPKSKEAQILNESMESARQAEKIWLEAMKSARTAGKKETVTGGEIKKAFSLKEDVEETKDLIAVHNITEGKLNKQLKLEGFPMISIAVTKTDIGHTNFGEISAVFTKKTIDPKNKKNKVYSADAWTATFPKVEYESNQTVSGKLKGMMYDAKENRTAERYLRSASYILSDVEYALNRYGGEEGVIDEALKNDGIKAIYLDREGKTAKEQTKEVKVEKDEKKAEIYKKIIKKFDVEKLCKMPFNDVIREHGDMLFEIVMENNEKIKEKVKEGYNWKESKMAKRVIQRNLIDARDYTENGGTKTEIVEDYEAEDKFIKENIDEKKYEKWVRENFKGIEKSKGIWNGKDPLTTSGRRRKFEATHYQYNAENIVKAMLAQNKDEKNVAGFSGVKTVRAAAADEFKSIEDIKNSSSRLQSIDTETYNKKLDSIESRLISVMSEIVGEEKDLFNHMNKMDQVGELILDAAGKPTEENVRKTINKYGWNITEKQAKEIADVINEIKQMPVNMFEAKPQRVIGYDEVAYWVVPDSISDETRKNIERVSKDANIVEYEEGNENQRKDILNGLNDVKFSIRDENSTLEENLRERRESGYSYESLAKIGSIKINSVKNTEMKIAKYSEEIKRKDVINTTRNNIEKYNKKMGNNYGDRYLYNKDLDSKVSINSESLKHGMIRMKNANIEAITFLPGYFENAVVVNEAEGKRKEAKNAYILMGAYEKKNGEIAIVRMEVNEHRGEMEVEDCHTLYALKAKKEDAAAAALGQDKKSLQDTSSFKITIAEMLDAVKEIYPNELSIETTRKMGYERGKSDIEGLRYMMRDISEVDYETLKEENRELRSINKNLQDMIALEYGAEPQIDAIKKVSKHILKKYESSYDQETLEKNLTEIWKYLANNKNPNGEELATITSSVAKGILEKSKRLDTDMREQYKDLLKGIRGTNLKLDEKYRGDMDQVGGYSEFRKKNFGKIRLSNEGIEVDSYYQELAAQYPELFDTEKYMTPADQLMNIADVIQMLQPTYINPYGMNMDQAAVDLAYEIYDSYYNIEKKGNALETKKIAELNRARSQYKEAQKKIREEMRQKYEQRMKVLKEENETLKKGESEKLLQQKAKYDSIMRRRTIAREESGERTQLLKALNRISRMKSTTENMEKAKELVGDIDIVAKSMTAQGQYNLELLRDRYNNELKNNPDFTESKSIEEKIKRLDKEKIADMGIGGVRDLLEAVLEFEHKVRTDAKQIDTEWRKSNYDLARKIEEEVNASKGYDPKNKASDIVNAYNTTILSAEREFRKIAGYAKDSQLENQAKELNKGQLKKIKFQQDAASYFKSFMDAEEKWINTATGEKATEIKIGEKNGKDILITPSMRMSLYLHAKAEANLRHIIGGTNVVKGQLNQYQGGGITVPDMDLYKKGKIKEAYQRGETIKLTKTGLQKILSEITPREKRFAEMVSGFFNGQMKDAINETSLKLDGYEKARVTNYYPIRTDSNFTNVEFEGLVKDATIEGMGMLKQRSGGTNPVMLEDIFSVLNRQIENVSSYYGLAIPIRNFNKIYNSTASGYEGSVKEAVGSKWGSRGQKYIENVLTDLQGGRRKEVTWMDKMRGNYAQAVLTLNPSVTMKQAASFPTAAATLGWGPVVKALTHQNVRTDRELIDKYSPLLWYRNQGNMTNDIADINNAKTWATKMPKGVQKYAMNWIQNMDTATVQRLWLASEYYVQDELNMKKGADGYYEKVAEVYNKVIEDTQPNYTVMQRPDILRNPSQAYKVFTMFSTQRLQNYGIVYDAIGEYKARLNDMKTGKGTKDDMAKAGKNLARAISSQIVAAAVLAGMTFVAGAALHRPDKWEDEDGKITVESFAKRFGSDMISTIAGSSIGGSELYSFLEAAITKGKWWGIEDNVVGIINDLGNDFKYMGDAISNLATGDGDIEKVMEKMKQTGKDAAKLFGVPAENAEKIIKGIGLWIADIKAGSFLKASDMYYTEYKKLWKMRGDKEAYDKYYKDLSEKIGESSVKAGLKAEELSELSYKEDMKELAKARENSDLNTYKKIMERLKSEGYEEKNILTVLNNKQKMKEVSYDDLWEVWIEGTKEQYEDLKTKAILSGKKEENIVTEMKKRQNQKLKEEDEDFQRAADALDEGNKELYENIRDELTKRYESEGYDSSRIANVIKGLRKKGNEEENEEEKEDEDEIF